MAMTRKKAKILEASGFPFLVELRFQSMVKWDSYGRLLKNALEVLAWGSASENISAAFSGKKWCKPFSLVPRVMQWFGSLAI